MGTLMAIYIWVFVGIILLSIFMVTTLVKALLFSVDKIIIFLIYYYFIHNYFSIKVASGNAVYFWDISLSLIAVLIYSILFKIIYDKIGILGKIIKFVISYAGVVAV